MENTANYNLKKPGLNDYVNINDLNENMDVIDNKLKENEEAVGSQSGEIDTINQEIQDIQTQVGNLENLSTTDKTNLVDSINELKTNIGNLTNLDTDIKTNLVAAVNDISKKVSEHQAEKVHQGEIHGFRLTEGKLEYFDGNEWQRVKGDGFPVGNISNFATKIDNSQVTLTWKDPLDTTIDDNNGQTITIAKWAGTKIIRKEGAYPVNENDGTLVVGSTIRNNYQTNGFVDDGLTNGKTYYYMAFPYSTEDVITVDSANRVSGKPIIGDDTSGSPGAMNLIGGDMQAGYFGTIPASQFITGDALASLVGISAGSSQHSNTDWMKFSIDGKVGFSPMKPIRYGINWNQINAADAIFGDKTVTIQGMQFKVRLWKGANSDPSSGYNGSAVRNSEWNKLMLPIHENAPSNWAYPDNVNSPTDWGVNFSDADLLTRSSHGNGSYTWCQETYSSYRILRGGNGVSYANNGSPGNTGADGGWRPFLELV